MATSFARELAVVMSKIEANISTCQQVGIGVFTIEKLALDYDFKSLSEVQDV